jgi:hypothetical protein
MLARRHRARALCRRAVALRALQGAHVRGLGRRRIGQRRHALGIGIDQRLFAPVPGIQQLLVGQAADQPGVDQPREIHAGNMARRCEHAVEIPDGLLRMRKMLGQETAAVVAAEKAVEAPQAVGLGADVQQVHHQQVPGLGALHAHGAGQEVHGGQVHVADVVGAVVVLDRASGPVVGFQDEIVPRLHPHCHRDVRMPAIVDLRVVVGGLGQIDLDERVSHSLSSPA